MDTAEEMILFRNYFVFDNDWDWHKRYMGEHGSEEEKDQDIPLLETVKEKYKGKIIKEIEERNFFNEGSEEIKTKQTIIGEESKYSLFLSAIENAMCLVVENNDEINDFDLMTSLKKLKQNIEFGTKELDRDAVIIKTVLGMPLSVEPITPHEVALCLQYFIKIIREKRQEFGKHAFVMELKEKNREREFDEDDESEDIYFNFIEKELEEQYYFLMSISDADEYEWAETEFHNVGISLMAEEKWEETEKLYKKQLNLYPECFTSDEDYGMLCWRIKRFEDAEKYLLMALQKAEKERTEDAESLDQECLDYIQENLAKIRKRETYKESKKE